MSNHRTGPVLATCLLALAATVASVPTVHAVAFQSGDVFAAIGNGLVRHYSPTGALIEDLDTTNGGFTTGMAFDASGNLYVTNFSANKVAKFSNSGSLLDASFITSGLSTPESIVFDNSGDIFIGNIGSGINKYDANGALLGTVTGGRVDWFDLTADQSTFYYGQEGSVVKTVSNALPGVAGADFATGLSNAFAMRIQSGGGLLIADQNDVKRFDSSGTLQQTYDNLGGTSSGWFSLNLDPDGSSFWAGSMNDGLLHKIDISSGTLLGSINTGVGGGRLFGVAVFGEITAGGPGPGPGPEPVPEPALFLLLGMGLAGVVVSRKARR